MFALSRAAEARPVPTAPPLVARVAAVLATLGEVTNRPGWQLANGNLRYVALERSSGAVSVGVLHSGMSSERDALEAAESMLAHRGFRVRWREAQKHVRGARAELLVLPAVRGSR